MRGIDWVHKFHWAQASLLVEEQVRVLVEVPDHLLLEERARELVQIQATERALPLEIEWENLWDLYWVVE